MAELIWDGKYDKDGRRAAPPRVALPFQTVETVNESAQERQRMLDLFSGGRDPEWRNRLIWGDKKYVLPSLLSVLAGKVDLIYIDPPFATGQDFSVPVTVDGHEFVKEPSLIELKAYRDTWGKGLDTYLDWFYSAVVVLCELLADMGSIYVHLDPGVSHYVKLVMDEVFGADNYRNEIIWERTTGRKGISQYGRVHDVILFYTKSDAATWNPPQVPQNPETVRGHDIVTDEHGRQYRASDLTGAGQGPARAFGSRGLIDPPRGRHWAYDQEGIDDLMSRGRIFFSRGGRPRLRTPLDELPGVAVRDLWTDIDPLNSAAGERAGYPTQKPEALLGRIIEASSNPHDLVLDCVCGSGTAAATAEKLNRRWIAADLGRFAVHTTRKRLLSIPNVRPFVVQNLGKYERQAWQGAEFGERAELAYRRFILDLYHAQPLSGYSWLHALKGGHMVHVGSVDAPVSAGDVRQIALEFRRAVGTGSDAPKTNRVDVLGWDFAFELNEVAKQQAALANIDFHFVRIPRDVMDRRAVEQGDISFFELAALSVDVCRRERDVTLTLTDFVIPLDDVPEDVRRAISHWAQWIDYWAVDWDNRSDTFHNEWQTYRTRKDPELQRSVSHTCDGPGCYTVVVKVIDILGNDTTKTLKVEVL